MQSSTRRLTYISIQGKWLCAMFAPVVVVGLQTIQFELTHFLKRKEKVDEMFVSVCRECVMFYTLPTPKAWDHFLITLSNDMYLQLTSCQVERSYFIKIWANIKQIYRNIRNSGPFFKLNKGLL